VGAENLAYCGLEERATGETNASAEAEERKTNNTYSCDEKAFILHTNCFAEHFVFE